MFPSNQSPGAAPLPPLPNLSGAGDQGGTPGDPMAALLSGIAPIKSAVDQILAACKMIVQSGAVPGAEQPCGQIVALATSLLPMAAQQMMSPGLQGPMPPTPQGGVGPVQGM